MYSSDLTDEQWNLIEHYFKRPDPRGSVTGLPLRMSKDLSRSSY